jgi:AmmeMemoRadiSam system protein B
MLVIPQPLVSCLPLFDGEHTDLDLRAELVRLTGELDVSGPVQQFVDTLSRSGFLHDELYEALREARHKEFAESPTRDAIHAGSAYPADRPELSATMADYMNGEPRPHAGKLAGIAAPHVSPFGGVESYRAAYSALSEDYRDRTFLILGTSHYGDPDRFGVTRKAFETPFGRARTELGIVDRLAKQRAALVEDYCHAVEHSIEFQVVFLQHLFGPEIKIVPVLCGSFYRSICEGGTPEKNDEVRAFLEELGEIGAKWGERLLWVLGIDMAHMGRRYGDPFTAEAEQGKMLEVAERDRARIERVAAGDAGGFWDLVQEKQDDLKWCGSSPLYTFLKAVPEARGALRGYQHWNIDAESVVTFGAMAFERG